MVLRSAITTAKHAEWPTYQSVPRATAMALEPPIAVPLPVALPATTSSAIGGPSPDYAAAEAAAYLAAQQAAEADQGAPSNSSHEHGVAPSLSERGSDRAHRHLVAPPSLQLDPAHSPRAAAARYPSPRAAPMAAPSATPVQRSPSAVAPMAPAPRPRSFDPAPRARAQVAPPLRTGGAPAFVNGLPTGGSLPTRQLGEQFWRGIHETLALDEQWQAVRQFVLSAC